VKSRNKTTVDGADATRLPMLGKRVVITRPHSAEVGTEAGNESGDEQDFASLLRSIGAEPIHIPAIKLVAIADRARLDATIAHLDAYDWVVFTSAAAVEFFWGEIAPSARMVADPSPHFAAVGPATRAALRLRGIEVDGMPTSYRGVEIVGILGDVSGKRILLPRSQQGNVELPNTLRRAGAQVDDLGLYAPVNAVIDEDARLQLVAGVDAVTFASGSAVRAFVVALQDDARFDDFWGHTTVACIGPSTAAVAYELGIQANVVATEHTVPGLTTALAAYFVQERHLQGEGRH
jgi:uroporphyrinogen III methyltransferase / synthase